MTTSKRKGTTWESAAVAWLRDNGWPHAERRALAGAADKGDVVGVPCVIECKSTNRLDLAGALDEAEEEARNAHAEFGVAWIKRRGHTSPGRAYVVMSGETFTRLLRAWDYAPTEDRWTP